MSSFDFLVLLLPVAFMLHDFEEIILFRRFLDRNAAAMATRFPRLSGFIARAGTITTPAFTLVVAEEFLLVAAISFAAVYYHYYAIWVAAFMAFFLHFIIHFAQCILLRRYTPGVATAVLLSPACIYALKESLATTAYTYASIAVLSVAGVLAMVLNLIWMHWLAGKWCR